jgi:dihydrofolate synthase/folylpolyglutamate synthase
MTGYRETYAVFSMLNDKDVAGVVRLLRGHIDHWLIAPLDGPRAMETATLKQCLVDAGVNVDVTICTNIEEACDRAYRMAGDGDRILAFGSFLTVAAAMTALRNRRP